MSLIYLYFLLKRNPIGKEGTSKEYWRWVLRTVEPDSIQATQIFSYLFSVTIFYVDFSPCSHTKHETCRLRTLSTLVPRMNLPKFKDSGIVKVSDVSTIALHGHLYYYSFDKFGLLPVSVTNKKLYYIWLTKRSPRSINRVLERTFLSYLHVRCLVSESTSFRSFI